jgi:hypothetical protein
MVARVAAGAEGLDSKLDAALLRQFNTAYRRAPLGSSDSLC